MESTSNPSTRNTMALASMISGIAGWAIVLLSFCGNLILSLATVATMGLASPLLCISNSLGCLAFVGWLLALIFGYMARKQIKETGETGSGMALAGLIMGGVGTALVIVLVILIVVVLLLGGMSSLISMFPYLNINR